MKLEKRNLFATYGLSCVLVTFYVLHYLVNENSVKLAARVNVYSKTKLGKDFQNVKECGCSRSFMYPPPHGIHETGPAYVRLNSSCSDEGTFYQAGQNVVSFSLFLDAKQSNRQENYYTEGLLQNLEMMQTFYPGYSLRLYTNIKLKRGTEYCKIICTNPDVFWCNVKITPSHGDLSRTVFRTWRFFALGDPSVDVFLPRDLDSLISAREAGVVEDWLLKADKAISLMRDRRRGHNEAILAGMWQASNNMLGMANASILREEIIKLSKIKRAHAYKGSDQIILKKVVFYPKAKDIVAYDAYNCQKWGKVTAVRPFPTQRKDIYRDFVGNKVDFLGGRGRFNYSSDVCPEECRPEHGKDWDYC